MTKSLSEMPPISPDEAAKLRDILNYPSYDSELPTEEMLPQQPAVRQPVDIAMRQTVEFPRIIAEVSQDTAEQQKREQRRLFDEALQRNPFETCFAANLSFVDQTMEGYDAEVASGKLAPQDVPADHWLLLISTDPTGRKSLGHLLEHEDGIEGDNLRMMEALVTAYNPDFEGAVSSLPEYRGHGKETITRYTNTVPLRGNWYLTEVEERVQLAMPGEGTEGHKTYATGSTLTLHYGQPAAAS